jgi:hypothetical protein
VDCVLELHRSLQHFSKYLLMLGYTSMGLLLLIRGGLGGSAFRADLNDLGRDADGCRIPSEGSLLH